MTSPLDGKVVPFGMAVDKLQQFINAPAGDIETEAGPLANLHKIAAEMKSAAAESVEQELGDFSEAKAAVELKAEEVEQNAAIAVLARDAAIAGGKFYATQALAHADAALVVGAGYVYPLPDGSLQAARKDSAAASTAIGAPFSTSVAVAAARSIAQRGNWEILGKATSVVEDAAAGGWRFSWGRLYAFRGSVGSIANIEAVANLLVPQGMAAYIDLAEAQVGGEFKVHVSTINPVSSGNAPGSYIEDSKIILVHVNNSIIGGKLGAQYFGVPAASVSAAALNTALEARSRRATWKVIGGLTKASGVGGAGKFSFGDLRLIRGIGVTSRVIQGVADLSVPVGQAAYVDLGGALNGNGKLDVQVTTAGSTGAGGGLVAGNMVDDERIYLIIHGTEGLGGELAPTAPPSLNPFVGQIWYRAPGCVVSFDPVTRTLAWSGDLTLPYKGGGQRIRLAAGSIVIPATGYAAAYLDLTMVALGGYTPAGAVKAGSYHLVATTQPDAYAGEAGQLPMFFFNTDTDFGSVNGFPIAALVNAPATSNLDSDDLVVKVGVDTISVFVKGAQPGSPKYLEQLITHLKSEAQGAGANAGNQDLWHLANTYEADITPGSLNFTRGRTINNGGEIECAIKELGADDYIGGVHGDEKLELVRLQLDGKDVPLNAVATLVGRELRLIQRSTLYRCNTPLTGVGAMEVVAQHIKNTTISRQRGWMELRMRPRITWSKALTIEAAMIPMVPIKRLANDVSGQQITDTAIRAPLFEPENIAAAGFAPIVTAGDLPYCRIFGPTGIAAEVEVFKAPANPSRSFYIANPVQYNKLYYSVAGNIISGGPRHDTVIGEVWDVDAVVRLTTNA